jgi:hypothetical protein
VGRGRGASGSEDDVETASSIQATPRHSLAKYVDVLEACFICLFWIDSCLKIDIVIQ